MKMLRMITWTSFLTWAGILTGIYYAVVIGRYYKTEITALLQGRRLAPPEQAGTASSDDNKTPELFKATEKAITALTVSLETVTVNGNNREEAMNAVKVVLRKYAYLKGTPYAIAIHHFLVRETNQSVRLNEDEVKGLWD